MAGAFLDGDRGRGRRLGAGQQRFFGGHHVHADRLDRIQAADGAFQFAFQGALVIDLLGKFGHAQGALGEQLITDGRALGQAFDGHLDARFIDLVGRHQDGAGTLELVRDG